MLLLLILTLLAYEAKGLENLVHSLQNFPNKAGETLFHYRPYNRLVHPGQNQKPQQDYYWPTTSIKNPVPQGPNPVHNENIGQNQKQQLDYSWPATSIKNTIPQGPNPVHNENIGLEADSECSLEGIRISQGQTGSLLDGTPLYTVQIANKCDSGCIVHLSCASFTSHKLMINPKALRLIAPGDCLLNDGQPLPSDDTISFGYASATQFPFTVRYLVC